MGFKRETLIAVVESNIDRHAEALELYKDRVKRWQYSQSAQRVKDVTPKLKAFRDLLTAKLKAGTLPTDKEINHILSSQYWESSIVLHKYAPRHADVMSVPDIDDELHRSLLRVLNSVTENELSYSKLAQLGYRNLKPVFTLASKLDQFFEHE